MTSRVATAANTTDEPEPFIKRMAKCPNVGCDFKGSYAEVMKHMSMCDNDTTEITNLDDCESIVASEISTALTNDSLMDKYETPRFPSRNTPKRESMVDNSITNCILGCGSQIARSKMESHIEKDCVKRIMSCTRARFGCTWMDEARYFEPHIEQCPFERLAPVLSKLTDKNTELQSKCKKYEREMATYETRLDEEAKIRSKLQGDVKQLSEELEKTKNVNDSGPEATHGSPNGTLETLRSENEMLQESLHFMSLPKFSWIVHKKDAVSRKMLWSPTFSNAGMEWQLRFVASDYPELYLYTKSKLKSGRGIAIKCRLFLLHSSQHSNKHIYLDVVHRFEKRGACGDRITKLRTTDLLDQRKGFIHVDGCLHLACLIQQVESFENKSCAIM